MHMLIKMDRTPYYLILEIIFLLRKHPLLLFFFLQLSPI